MSEINTNNNGVINLGGIDGEKDPKPIIIINPPPGNGKCECCGRHISELKPFGGPGDDLPWGEFTTNPLAQWKALLF
jgi:hypothetical protein